MTLKGFYCYLPYRTKYKFLPVSAINHQYEEAMCSKLGKGVLETVFLHRYNNPMQMKPEPDPEP
jgi:hypothetical protein